MPEITIRISKEAEIKIRRLLETNVLQKKDFDEVCEYLLLASLAQVSEIFEMQKSVEKITPSEEDKTQ